MTPFSLFEEDERFNKATIEKMFVKGAPHFPWVENPQEGRLFIEDFAKTIQAGLLSELRKEKQRTRTI